MADDHAADAYLVKPELVRLSTWARLERTPTGDLYAHLVGHDKEKLQSIVDAQHGGHIDPALHPVDVHSLVIAVSLTWSPASALIAATGSDDLDVHERRQHALARAVDKAFRP